MASHVLQELPKTQRLCLYHDHDPAQHFCLFCLLSLVRKKMSADTRKLLKEESLEASQGFFSPNGISQHALQQVFRNLSISDTAKITSA